MTVMAEDIVRVARQLDGALYRWWYDGASLPMWRDDGYVGAPDPSYFMQYGENKGVMCSDLINYAMEVCGLRPIGGTAAWNEAIVDWKPFDPDAPGEPGAIAVKGYSSEWAQGHIVLYTGEHSVIQAINYPGVTEAFTDAETYQWDQCDFDWYGKIPGVTYGQRVVPVEPPKEIWKRCVPWYEEVSQEVSFWIADRRVGP